MRGFPRATASVRGAFLAAALGLVGVAILPLDAGAAVRAKVDRPHELRFALDGRTLTLTIVDLRRFSQQPTTRSELIGKRVRIACGTSFRKVHLKTVVMSTVRWPRGHDSISVQLARDISRRVVWCVVESPRPRGSRVRAQYFTALLRGPAERPPDVSSVAAYDAEGRLIARDRRINGAGVDCGRRDER